VRYYDGFTNDARLNLDTLRSAARAGAQALNYCRFRDARRAGGQWVCEIEDRLAQQAFALRARAVVNATGPWADGLPHSRVRLRLTKGIHLVVDRARLPVPETVVMTEGRRILFAIPWGERTILGTTDTDYAGAPDDVRADAQDVGYVLAVTNRFFPRAQLAPADVISTWAGLRPLIARAHGAPSDLSRAHTLANPEPGWWDVAGGKLTTYRRMAEQTVDRIVREQRWRVAACRTALEPLLPADSTDGVSGLLPPAFSRSVVDHYVAQEWAVHLDDVMIRRTGWHYYCPDADARAQTVADWMAERLGWTQERRAAELRRYRQTGGEPRPASAAALAPAAATQASSPQPAPSP